MEKLSSEQWVYATKRVGEITYISFAQAEGEVEEPLSSEKAFFRQSMGDCQEFVSDVYTTRVREEAVSYKLESAGFVRDTAGRVYMLDYLESEGMLEKEDDDDLD